MSSPATPGFLSDAVEHLRSTGGGMPALIERHGVPELRRTRNSLASLGRAIVSQQLSGRAADTIYRRFLALFPGGRFPSPERLLAVPAAELRGAGLSAAKAAALLDLARGFASGRVDPRRFGSASDAEVTAMLVQIKGIGPWSADMFLIFGLNRPDVLPVGDLGVRKGMQRYFRRRELPDPGTMQRLARPWQPFRSVASWYMWRVAEEGLP